MIFDFFQQLNVTQKSKCFQFKKKDALKQILLDSSTVFNVAQS